MTITVSQLTLLHSALITGLGLARSGGDAVDIALMVRAIDWLEDQVISPDARSGGSEQTIGVSFG